jgi:hypothetical protein
MDLEETLEKVSARELRRGRPPGVSRVVYTHDQTAWQHLSRACPVERSREEEIDR